MRKIIENFATELNKIGTEEQIKENASAAHAHAHTHGGPRHMAARDSRDLLQQINESKGKPGGKSGGGGGGRGGDGVKAKAAGSGSGKSGSGRAPPAIKRSVSDTQAVTDRGVCSSANDHNGMRSGSSSPIRSPPPSPGSASVPSSPALSMSPKSVGKKRPTSPPGEQEAPSALFPSKPVSC